MNNLLIKNISRIKIIIVSLLFSGMMFSMLSCRQLSKIYNGTNKFKRFDNKEIYIQETSKDIKIDASKIIVLNDSNYSFWLMKS